MMGAHSGIGDSNNWHHARWKMQLHFAISNTRTGAAVRMPTYCTYVEQLNLDRCMPECIQFRNEAVEVVEHLACISVAAKLHLSDM